MTTRKTETVNTDSGDEGAAARRKARESSKTTPAQKARIRELRQAALPIPFLDLWKTLAAFVRAICIEKGLRPLEAEDVSVAVQNDVFTQIYRYDEDKGRFHAWLGKITRNKADDVLRKRIPEERLFDKLSSTTAAERKIGEVPAKGDGPATLVCKREEREIAKSLLERVAARVKPEQYQIFDCAVLREWSVEKVCKTLGVTANRVYIARNRVGKIYNEELATEGKKIRRDLDRYRAPEYPKASERK